MTPSTTAVLLCAVLALSQAASIVPLNTSVSKSLRNSVLDLEGVIRCGAFAEIADIRFTGCERTPCQTNVGNTYRLEVDFHPSRSHPKLDLRIVLAHGDQVEVIVDGEVADSAVEAGTRYTFGYSIVINGAFTGPAVLIFNLVGADENGGNHPELCLNVDINVA